MLSAFLTQIFCFICFVLMLFLLQCSMFLWYNYNVIKYAIFYTESLMQIYACITVNL